MISFLLNDKRVDITDSAADRTLLTYLRETCHLTGTKEGCASGDCGACTVVVAEPVPDTGALRYRPVNACITLLSAVHGKQLLTVEHLAEGQQLHPVQQAMVDNHGSQCGFCTPGFVMSMFALYHSDEDVGHDTVDMALSGNLCRCTGYRPIIDAALQSCKNRQPDKFDQHADKTVQALSVIPPTEGITGLYLPENRAQLAKLKAQHPYARLVAGSTDLALESTQNVTDLSQLISVSRVTELLVSQEDDDGITLGAALPLTDIEPVLLRHYPELKEVLWRFASTPIRNQATLGGNVANASPIGDMPPVLLALGAKVNVDNGSQRRQIDASAFFTGYRQTALRDDEWIESIFIPARTAHQQVRAYKVSKRHEDDISAVCAVFSVQLVDGRLDAISTGFGGVAATPVTANDPLRALKGMDWTDTATLQQGKDALSSAFTPIDDVRATANYRRQLCANLFHRLWLETTNHSIETRVIQYA